MGIPLKARRTKWLTQFPYLLPPRTGAESEGVKLYAVGSILIAVGALVGWWSWFDHAMGGRGSDRAARQVVASPVPVVGDSEPGPGMRLAGLEVQPTPTRYPTGTPLVVVSSVPDLRSTVAVVVTPEFTPVPVVTVVQPVVLATPVWQWRPVVVIGYWPDAGPDWCKTWDGESGRCVSLTASGEDWRLLDGLALACPASWLGHQVNVPDLGGVFRCVDVGVSFYCGGEGCKVGLISSSSVAGGSFGAWLYPAVESVINVEPVG